MPIRARRGTKAALDALAIANSLRDGDFYYLTDLKLLAVGTSVNSYAIQEVLNPIRSGLQICAAVNQLAPGTQALTANVLRAFPWRLKSAVTLGAIRSEVSTLVAATTYRLGLYADNGAAYPGSLITNSDTGTFDAATGGVKTASFTAAIVLQPGWYWVAVNSNGAPTLRSIAVGAIENLLGVQGSLGTNSTFTGWTIAQTYAALPSVFPAGATLLVNTLAPLAAFTTQ
jgi:hypothetical protein